jgi:hypothetical protein
MQQDNNHIENKLRQLENQQLPDLSAMDVHWKEMKNLVQPYLPKAKPLIPKNIFWMIGAACLVGVVLLILNWGSEKQSQLFFADDANTKQETEILSDTLQQALLKNDSVKLYVPNSKKLLTSQHVNQPNILIASKANIDSLSANFIINKDSSTKIIGLSVTAKKEMLSNLIAPIKKTAEIFAVDNTKDTIIKCKEGSVLIIPSHAFNTKDSVIFEVKEFYNYGDMVTNGLTTMSDNQQLITGGMIYLSAKVNGKEIAVNPEKEIRVFIPNLTAKDSMQIFEGVVKNKEDTVSAKLSKQDKINWQLTRYRIDSPVLKMFVRAIDLKDDHIDYTTTYNGKTKAVFYRATQSVYSKEELKVILQKKYGGYYDKIRVRKQWERNLLFKKVESTEEEYYQVAYNSYGVGDTAELQPFTIKINKLEPIDTVYKIVRWINTGYKDVRRPDFPSNTLNEIGEKYSIGLNKLGWINCDRFFKYPGKKIDFVVDLKDSSFNYITYLVFENFKSIMQSGERGNYAVFSDVPVGEPVKVISIGIRNGKTMAVVKNTITGNSILNDLQFESTTSSELKYTLSKLEK